MEDANKDGDNNDGKQKQGTGNKEEEKKTQHRYLPPTSFRGWRGKGCGQGNSNKGANNSKEGKDVNIGY